MISPRPLALFTALALLPVCTWVAPALAEPMPPDCRPGQPVDLVRFGKAFAESGALGVEWDNPRNVHEVHVVLAHGAADTLGKSLRLQWWGSVWPNNGSGGWMRLGDAWNGKWVTVDAKPQKGDGADEWVFRFPPLAKAEWKESLDDNAWPDKKPPTWRRTLKVRVRVEGGTLPPSAQLMVFGESRWKLSDFAIESHGPRSNLAIDRIDAVNGYAEAIRSAEQGGRAARLPVQSRVRVLYADTLDLNSNDLTRVMVRLTGDPRKPGFSFVPQDVPAEGMRLADFGAIVRRGDSNASAHGQDGRGTQEHGQDARATEGGQDARATEGGQDARATEGGRDARPPAWEKTVRQRVNDRPEATYASAMAGIPRLQPARWVPLGVPSARQEPMISPAGDWSMWHGSLHTPGRDSQRIPFRKPKHESTERNNLDAILDTRLVDPKFDGKDRTALTRYLEGQCLPMIHCEWETGPIRYHHTLLATILLGEIGDDDTRRGDETVVLLTKLEVINTAPTTQPAAVHLRYSHDAPLALRDDGLITIEPADKSLIPGGLTATRGQISTGRPTGGGAQGFTTSPADGKGNSAVLNWQTELRAGESSEIYFKAPWVDLLDKTELQALQAMSFEQEAPKALDYWRKRLSAGMRIEVPDGRLNDLYNTALWHVLITTDRDPQTGLYNQGVGTMRYKVFANETIMIARQMDMRGEHKEAERFIEPLLHYQGDKGLTGRFSTKEGVFHSAGDYTHGEYAMNHGFVLWGVAEHYFFTRDRAWLQRVAPQVVKGCDFLIHERQATLTPEGRPRLPYHGLAPACALEDVVEYQYWFATNGYFHLGLKKAAEALADINHPDAKRIAAEAENYRRDIEAALREATVRSAAVRLRNGNWIPYVPSRVYHWRHLTEGWIREALYCSLHMASTEVLPPDDPAITWMLDELEDNTFFSGQSGYDVKDYETTWFERGAVTLQPCLMDSPTIYLARNEFKAALRSFWNTYALSIYPDVNCFAEWAKRFGQGGGPVYKTSDECRFLMWLRQFLVWEDGQVLRLAYGTPRAWFEPGRTIRIENAMTFFGKASLTIRSQADQGRIHATVALPTRNPPSEVWLRLREPFGKMPVRVSVNGQLLPRDRIRGEDIQLVAPGAEVPATLEVKTEY